MDLRVIEIRIPDLPKVQAKLQPKLVRDPAGRMIRDAAAFALRETKSGAPSGAIAQSITATVKPMEAQIRGSGAALAVEFGRHPGTPAPPADALRAWAAARGLSEFIYPIARAIQRRGIKGRFFLRKAVAKLRNSELPRLAEKAKAEIETEWKS
jgi:hypothetical protein